MKFVCERCHTKYSIADEKVRGKVLKVRCKTCANVITVRETGATTDDAGATIGPREAAISRSGSFDAGDGATIVAPRPTRMSHAKALPVAALFAPGAPAVAPPARARRATPSPHPGDEVEWYLAVDGAQTGPFPRSRLLDKILSTPRGADIHVWHADLDGWKPPAEVAEIEADLVRRRRVLTPVPPPLLRRPTGSAVPLAAGEGHSPSPSAGPALASTMAASAGGWAAVDVTAETAKGPHPAPKKNGVNAAAAAAAAAEPIAESPLGRFGLGDLLGEGSGRSTAFAPAAQKPDAAAQRGASAEAVVMLTPPPVAAPGVVGVAPSAGFSTAIASGRSKHLKLLLSVLAVVVVLCGIVSFWMFRRPTPATENETSSSAGKATPTDFAGMAEKLARDEAKTEKPAEAPAVTGAPPPPVVAEQKPLVARIEPVQKVAKGKGRRNGKNQSTSPPPLGASGPGLTAEQRDAASRFGESTGREVRVPTQMGASARSTPAQADISRVINNNRQGIQTCYQRALLRDNTLTHGKVTVRVSIGLSGKVKSVNLDAPAQFRALEPCIRDVMSRWAFPPSSEEYGTEFPVVLQGNQ